MENKKARRGTEMAIKSFPPRLFPLYTLNIYKQLVLKMAKIKKICEQCEKPFWVIPSRKDTARFCSSECWYKFASKHRSGEDAPNWKGGKIKCVCEMCGKPFFVKPYRKDSARFCSFKCHDKYKREQLQGENSPAWRGGRIERVCMTCEKSFFADPYDIRIGFGKFCSRECASKWRSEHYRGKNSWNWKGGEVQRICLTCGKHFTIKPSLIKSGGGKYCSRSCQRRARRFSTHHTKPELIFERICKENDLPFSYVGDRSLWIGNKRKINPDFIEVNGKKICVEIMGDYWHSPLINRNMKEYATLDYRNKHYRRFKWTPIFIWETDLLREDAEAFVLNKLQKEVQ